MEEAVFRLKIAADAGADVCFIEGVKTKELLESTVAALAPKPVSKALRLMASGVELDHLIGPGQRYIWWTYPVIHNQRGRSDGSKDYQ